MESIDFGKALKDSPFEDPQKDPQIQETPSFEEMQKRSPYYNFPIDPKVFTYGAGETATLSLGNHAYNATLSDSERKELQQRLQESPWTRGAGQVAGILGLIMGGEAVAGGEAAATAGEAASSIGRLLGGDVPADTAELLLSKSAPMAQRLGALGNIAARGAASGAAIGALEGLDDSHLDGFSMDSLKAAGMNTLMSGFAGAALNPFLEYTIPKGTETASKGVKWAWDKIRGGKKGAADFKALGVAPEASKSYE